MGSEHLLGTEQACTIFWIKIDPSCSCYPNAKAAVVVSEEGCVRGPSVKALCMALVLLQLGLSWALFALRYFEQGSPVMPEFALKEEALLLSGHLIAYFTVLFVPAHVLFFFEKGRSYFGIVVFGTLIACLGPFLSFWASLFELGVWYVGVKAFGLFVFSGIWVWLSYRAFLALFWYYSFLFKKT